MRCDGKSDEEVFQWERQTIERFGHVVMGVEGSPQWAYTMGLSAGHGHPELLVCGLDFSLAMRVLNAVAARIASGSAIRPGDACTVGDRRYQVVPVPEERWHDDDTFNGWWNHYDRFGNEPRAEAVELIPELGHARRCRLAEADIEVPDYVSDLLPS
jgi:hypothetical protein